MYTYVNDVGALEFLPPALEKVSHYQVSYLDVDNIHSEIITFDLEGPEDGIIDGETVVRYEFENDDFPFVEGVTYSLWVDVIDQNGDHVASSVMTDFIFKLVTASEFEEYEELEEVEEVEEVEEGCEGDDDEEASSADSLQVVTVTELELL